MPGGPWMRVKGSVLLELSATAPRWQAAICHAAHASPSALHLPKALTEAAAIPGHETFNHLT